MKNKRSMVIGLLVALILFSGLLLTEFILQQKNIISPGLFIWKLPSGECGRQSVTEAVCELNVKEIYCLFDRKQLTKKSPETFIRQMKSEGVNTWFLMGEAEWGLDSEGTEICQMIYAVAAYNESVSEDARFVGITLDIEPYSTPEWEEDREKVMRSWRDALIQAKQCASENGLSVMVCIPRWLDEMNAEILEAIIRDGCDQVAIMNYGRKKEISSIEGEIKLADRYGKPVVNISELTEPGVHGLTEDQTYYHLGLETVMDSWKQIKSHYAKSDLHFAYHHITPLLELME